MDQVGIWHSGRFWKSFEEVVERDIEVSIGLVNCLERDMISPTPLVTGTGRVEMVGLLLLQILCGAAREHFGILNASFLLFINRAVSRKSCLVLRSDVRTQYLRMLVP
jgi:hypothetical protein